MSEGAAATAMVMLVCIVLIVANACGTQKQQAVERAELSCLATAGAEFAQQSVAAGSAGSDGRIAMSLSIPTVLCMLQALGASPPQTSTALPAKAPADAK